MPATSQRFNDPGSSLTSHPELEAERAYIDYAYGRLESMRADAMRRRDAALEIGAEEMRPLDPTGEDGLGGLLFEREAFHSAGVARLRQLEIGEHSLVFGRIDLEDGPPMAGPGGPAASSGRPAAASGGPASDGPPAPESGGARPESGETFYIGRLAVSGPDREPVVVDWRAPVAEPFYRATGLHPLGLRRRRHFVTEGRRLIGIEDEVFGADGGHGPTGALMVALERSRTGRMRDIVSTIQREQDEVIRAPLQGVLIVQGGPGTGKTAVALHRAAYLLFTHRQWLDRRGLLVIGPNQLFLQYIDQVLPALGESGVALSTLGGLVPRVTVKAEDPPHVASVKGDERMARVLSRAVRTRERGLHKTAVVDFDGERLTLTPQVTQRIVRSARSAHGTHNAKRGNLERLIYRELHRQYRKAKAPEGHSRPRAGDPGPEEFAREARKLRDVRLALDRMWPRLTPAELVHDLFGSRALLDDAAGGLLSRMEISALERPWSKSLKDVAWTSADLPLLDEALVLLGPLKRTQGEAFATYGHVVVDEVQDMTPMQLRMLARRAPTGSLTLVGDLAQSTSAAAVDGWDDLLSRLPTHSGVRRAALTVNYRTPSEVMDYAGRVLRAADLGIEPPESVRSTGDHPAERPTSAEALSTEAVSAALAHADDLDGGTVAVVCPPSMLEGLDAAFAATGARYGEAGRDGLAERITLVAVDVVKGLEFDAVVVVEPAAIVREALGGLKALYVALTRATRHVTVVHAEDLPPEMRQPVAARV